MNTPDSQRLQYTHALIADNAEASAILIGMDVKNSLRSGGAICIEAVEGETCHSDLTAAAPGAEKDSSNLLLTLPSVAERSLVEAVHALVLQIAQSNQEHRDLLRVLAVIAEQNAELIAQLSQDDDEEEEARMYLDGSAM